MILVCESFLGDAVSRRLQHICSFNMNLIMQHMLKTTEEENNQCDGTAVSVPLTVDPWTPTHTPVYKVNS